MSAVPISDSDLVAAVERARGSVFYTEHLAGRSFRGRADLCDLPLTTKDHLRDASPNGMLIVPRDRAWHYNESSGTTGEPISTWAGLPEMGKMAELIRASVPELADDTMLLNRFPLFSPVAFVFEELMRLTGACHIAAGNVSWDVPFTRAVDFLRRLQPSALACLPLEPLLLAEVAKDEGLDLKKDLGSLKVIFCGGAPLPPSLRRLIESDWGTRVVEIYGSNETMLMGVGCTEGKLHLASELLEFEILDPKTWEPVPPGGRGIVTVTSLVHTVMPLVRYVTGDLVEIEDSLCTCGGSGFPIRVLGRLEEKIEIGGRSAMHYDVLDAVHEFADALDTRIFFVVVRAKDVQIMVEVEDPTVQLPTAAYLDLRRRIGLPIDVELVSRNESLDRSALFRAPKIYKPSLISDWRGGGRRAATVMEALLEWPSYDLKTLLHLAKRQIRTARRRRRFARGMGE
jgi:phenylacetate-CoA ligase